MRKIMILTLAVLLMGMFTAGNLFAGQCSGHKAVDKATASTDAKVVTASAGCPGAMKAGCKMTPEQCAKLCGKDGHLTPEECAKLCGKDSKCEFTTFSVNGMTCGGCENTIKAALTEVDGVYKVIDVNHMAGVAEVCYDAAKTSSSALAAVITNKGYQAEVSPAVATGGEIKRCCPLGGKLGCAKTSKAKTETKSDGPH
ncbi:MAG: heavy-metal-associated domain-containing protein [bacterium]